ncbi:hypothetical protein [Pseudomaricurvus sp. HS19]|uniref:hypothetical protein n=1 Tax=Pseudomaricurvus sp. HS19 TaxID=2692626 RepID=UPI00136FCFBB|nr:hypothetical protein [Pseudomaricurvus sp. HS19]MYM63035.1 hypothetical protein [Pseudomaricurvus sp. HS19]
MKVMSYPARTGQWLIAALMLLAVTVHAQESATAEPGAGGEKKQESPWLLAPTISSDPKVGTSAGGLGGYLFKIDPDSTSSMAGAMATYSNTDSLIAGLFLRSFWNADARRFSAVALGGRIRNDYEDFLGSGLPISSTDEVKMFFSRYQQEVVPHWFLGAQAIYTNYLIVGDNFTSAEVLKLTGLTGYDAAGLGLVAQYDTRDSKNSPLSGMNVLFNNFAYRESFGGEVSFDAYNLKGLHYLPHGNGHVFATHVDGRWTDDAPSSGYSSVTLRGYTRGQYLAPHSFLVEFEERIHVKGRFGINLFAGVACLYGDGLSCDDSANLYSSFGIGAQYVLKPSERIVITMDYAQGEGGNNGFYMRFGQAF